MAKTKWKLIKDYEGTTFKTALWWNDTKKVCEIWRNKKCVYTFNGKGFVTHEDFIEHCKAETGNWISETEHSNLTLNEYLHRNNIQLTPLEIASLWLIFREGSFYEESCSYDDNDTPYVDRKYGAFIGWDIDEKELPGCRGALGSLVKKGILTVFDDDCNGKTIQGYYIHFTPEFKEGQYHFPKIDEENQK